MPTLLSRKSSRPQRSTAASTSRLQSASLVMSPAWLTAVPPSALIISTVRSASFWSRSATTHLGAGARQQDRRGAAVADAVARRAAARDDRDLAGQAGVVLRSLHCFPLSNVLQGQPTPGTSTRMVSMRPSCSSAVRRSAAAVGDRRTTSAGRPRPACRHRRRAARDRRFGDPCRPPARAARAGRADRHPDRALGIEADSVGIAALDGGPGRRLDSVPSAATSNAVRRWAKVSADDQGLAVGRDHRAVGEHQLVGRLVHRAVGIDADQAGRALRLASVPKS